MFIYTVRKGVRDHVNQLLNPCVVVTTSYGTGPYLISNISKLCTCPKYESIPSKAPARSSDHYHLTLKAVDGKGGEFYLNGYYPDDEGVWRSVWSDDYLILKKDSDLTQYPGISGGQLELF